MNINVPQNVTAIVNNCLSKLWNVVDKIHLTELLVGVVVPIVAALISYTLAERATRRKEYNRLFIQIELVKKELMVNKNSLNGFIMKYEENSKLKKELEFPTAFCKGLLVAVLEELEKIKKDYFYFDKKILFEKPNCLYIIAQRIDSINQEIETEELKYYDDEYLKAKQKIKVSKLKETKEECITELKNNKDRDIYREFSHIQSFIEKNSFKNMFEKTESNDKNFEILKYIYNCIKAFNSKENKDKSDVANLYEELVLFKISPDVMNKGYFNQDTFDLYYKEFEKYDGLQKLLLDICEQYYKMTYIGKFIKEYQLQIFNRRWNEYNGEMVLLSDSELYISINELYEEIQEFEFHFKERKNKDLDETYEYSKTMVLSIVNIISKLEKHQEKIKKWCK